MNVNHTFNIWDILLILVTCHLNYLYNNSKALTKQILSEKNLPVKNIRKNDRIIAIYH